MIIKSEYPILEYSTESTAVINPYVSPDQLPRLCLMTFFGEVFDKAVENYKGILIGTYTSEMKDFHVYKISYNALELCIIQAAVGSASIAMMSDWLYAKGVEVIIACGGCGVLDDIPSGHVILPTQALRDDGASYKYLPPSRFIKLSQKPIETFKSILDQHNIPFTECISWTTDGFYRETSEMVAYRKSEGCKVVEMECATLASVAQFRNKVFGQILYSGDILMEDTPYDDREWYNNYSTREKLFYIALESLCLL